MSSEQFFAKITYTLLYNSYYSSSEKFHLPKVNICIHQKKANHFSISNHSYYYFTMKYDEKLRAFIYKLMSPKKQVYV
jgi:hypothetical protein